MAIFSDSRILARIQSAQAGQTTSVRILAEGLLPLDVALPASAHPLGCACGLHRGPIATALDTVFLARARGTAPLFRQIEIFCTTEAARAAIREALVNDPVAFTRFKVDA